MFLVYLKNVRWYFLEFVRIFVYRDFVYVLTNIS